MQPGPGPEFRFAMVPHAGGSVECVHNLLTLPQLTLAENTILAPGGPEQVHEMSAEQRHLSHGPEGVCIQPSGEPGFGWDFEVEASFAADSPPMPPLEDVGIQA